MNQIYQGAEASFVVPIRDGSLAEIECVDSILAQPWPRLELVCIGERSAIERLMATVVPGPLLLTRPVATKTTGVAKMFNQGASAATGDALFLVSRPVVLLPEFTGAWMARLFEEDGTALVYGDFLESGPVSSETRAQHTRTIAATSRKHPRLAL